MDDDDYDNLDNRIRKLEKFQWAWDLAGYGAILVGIVGIIEVFKWVWSLIFH